jgi:hypothetical protein
MLKEGDIIEIKKGMTVYAEVPLHFLYSNRKGVFDKKDRGDIKIDGQLAYLAGRYVVYKTCTDGGGMGHGPGDIYPDGHHVFCEKLENREHKVDFYQTGCFTVMYPDIKRVGRAEKAWMEKQ